MKKSGQWIHVDVEELDRLIDSTVFVGRFIALLRTWAAVLAGIGKMWHGVFMAYNAAGGILWSVAFGALGYIFGRNFYHNWSVTWAR